MATELASIEEHTSSEELEFEYGGDEEESQSLLSHTDPRLEAIEHI